MQTSAPPGKPAPPHAQLDDATNLNTAFNAHFDKAVEEPVKEVAPAPEPPPPEPVAEITPAPAVVDAPIEIVIPEAAQREIDRIVETSYQKQFVDPLKRDHEDLVRGIAQHLQPWKQGVDIERDFVGVLLKMGADEKEFTPQYVEDRISDMKCSNILKQKMRLDARDFFARKQKREEADQTDWKGMQRRGVEQNEIEARKDVHLLKTVLQEAEFSEFRRLRSLADVGDSFAQAELDKIDAYWKPRAQSYINQGYGKRDAVRMAWKDALRELKITLGPGREPEKPKKSEPASEKPKARKPYGSLQERLAKELEDSFKQNLSTEQMSTRGGYFK